MSINHVASDIITRSLQYMDESLVTSTFWILAIAGTPTFPLSASAREWGRRLVSRPEGRRTSPPQGPPPRGATGRPTADVPLPGRCSTPRRGRTTVTSRTGTPPMSRTGKPPMSRTGRPPWTAMAHSGGPRSHPHLR